MSGPLTVSVVPAAMGRRRPEVDGVEGLAAGDRAAREDDAWRLPGSSVPAVYVQLFAVRIVPARVSVPDGLLMTTGGQAAGGGVAAPVNVWAPAPLMSRVAVPPANVEAWLIGPWAASVPVPLRRPR